MVRMRINRSATGKRRSHHALKEPRLSLCECGAKHLRHRACDMCGKYRGRVVIDVEAQKAKKAAKKIARLEAERAHGGAIGEDGATSSADEKEKSTESSDK